MQRHRLCVPSMETGRLKPLLNRNELDMQTTTMPFLLVLSLSACGGRETSGNQGTGATAAAGGTSIGGAGSGSPAIDGGMGGTDGNSGGNGVAGGTLGGNGGVGGNSGNPGGGTGGGPSLKPCPTTPVPGAQCAEPVYCEHERQTCLCRDTSTNGRIWMCGELACPSDPPVPDTACRALAICASGSKVCGCDFTNPTAPRWSCGEGGCPATDPTSFRGFACETAVGFCRFRLNTGENAICNCPVFDTASVYSCSLD
jgi:hypothetical protein